MLPLTYEVLPCLIRNVI